MELSKNENIILQDIFNNNKQINSMYNLLFSELKDMNIDFTVSCNKNLTNKKSALVIPSNIIMNNQYIGIVVILIGIATYENNGYTFIVKERII